jgi:phosphoserine phosphatase
MSEPAFASVVLDVDSTLCGIEGIDFLATRRGPEVGQRIAELTDGAMRGEIALESVYGERLAIIQPTAMDLRALADAYVATTAPDADMCIRRLRNAAARVVLVSGGIRQAIAPVAALLGFDDADLHAVSLDLDAHGRYVRYDTSSPLTTTAGKKDIVGTLIEKHLLPRPVLAVGDGSTDVAMSLVADRFAAFTGFARREAVVRAAHLEIRSFRELMGVVLGESGS